MSVRQAVDMRSLLVVREVKELRTRLFGFGCSRHGPGSGAERPSGPRAACTTGVDEQPKDRIRDSVESGDEGR